MTSPFSPSAAGCFVRYCNRVDLAAHGQLLKQWLLCASTHILTFTFTPSTTILPVFTRTCIRSSPAGIKSSSASWDALLAVLQAACPSAQAETYCCHFAHFAFVTTCYDLDGISLSHVNWSSLDPLVWGKLIVFPLLPWALSQTGSGKA